MFDAALDLWSAAIVAALDLWSAAIVAALDLFGLELCPGAWDNNPKNPKNQSGDNRRTPKIQSGQLR